MRWDLSRTMFAILVVTALPSFSQAQAGSGPESAYSYVDPISGSSEGGNTFPGATVPFGMVQWSPDTTADGWYRYNDKTLRGFSLTHVSGAGCSIYADVPVLGLVGLVTDTGKFPADMVSGFSHDKEVATPGYYSIVTADGIRTELAASERAGIARITFPEGQLRTILIKASDSANVNDSKRAHDETEVEVRADGTVVGTVESGGFCGTSDNYTLYFAISFNGQAQARGAWTNILQQDARSAKGHRAGAYVTFPASSEPLLLKTGISFVSKENAEANLHAEIGGWDFDAVRKQARERWVEALGRAQVEGGSADDLRIYYTGLYHMLLSPNVFSDVNGDYIGFDGKVRRLAADEEQYANFSDWDIYRNTIQLQAWLAPEKTSQELQSLVRDAEQSGWLPKWPVANDVSYVMGGDSAANLIASGYAFGARSFDVPGALKIMVHGAITVGTGLHGGSERPHLDEYLKNGYIAVGTDGVRESAASISLEYASADFATSRLAAAIGDRDDAAMLLKHSANWRIIFDPESRLIRPRLPDGSFVTGWDPEHLMPRHHSWDLDNQFGFEEGSSLQYSLMIPFDYADVLAAMGGDQQELPRLEKFFSTTTGWGVPGFTVGNEPDFCAPYVYLWTSQPWKLAEVVDKTRREAFHTGPAGLPGNDDLGATSGVYVWSALGLYPVIPGVGAVALGSPLFKHAALEISGGKRLEISRSGEGIYVQSVQLNGKALSSAWLPLDRLDAKTNRLQFVMGTTPNRSWAAREADKPPSYTAQSTDFKTR
jgi:predicted alpha-1,2-mannosidase